MAEVSVKVSDRTYRLACRDNEQDRLKALGEFFSEKVESLRAEVGAIRDDCLVVMAAIMVTDELWEERDKVQKLQASQANSNSQSTKN